MILGFVIFVLIVSLVFYTIFAGADFGAGILEFFNPKDEKRAHEISHVVDKAIGPVWEANHIWLILAVVIFFMGFPHAFSPFSIYYHVPLTFVLLGIIGRGTAFTFRHYDAFKDESQKLYSFIFRTSSVWTSFWLGTIFGSLLSGPLPERGDFLAYYVLPWANLASMSMGVFVIFLFCFLASLFLISETSDNELARYFRRRSLVMFAISVVVGFIVLVIHSRVPGSVIFEFFKDPRSIALFLISTLLMLPMTYFYRRRRYMELKAIGVTQVLLVTAGGLVHQFPIIMRFESGRQLDLFNAAAPEATLIQLAIALLVGVICIFPALIFLFKVFKSEHFKT